MHHDFKKVAVLLGGTSSEREVSLKSGQAVLNALLIKGIHAELFDPSERSLTDLVHEHFDCAFIALHGGIGENGVIQGALEALHIPYTGCGVSASAIGMDKYLCKLIWQASDLPIPRFYLLDEQSDLASIAQNLGLPLFIKPAIEGSSVGVIKVRTLDELIHEYAKLKEDFDLILAEEFIGGGEYTCAILGEQALPSIKIVSASDFYDYDAKYLRDDTQYLCPSDLSDEDEQLMRQLALSGFNKIGGRGWGRVDFLQAENGQLYLLEVNTVPGMTDHSLVPKAAEQIGLNFADLCIEILKYAKY